MLEVALGYNGKADFVAFYWTPHGDELVYRDASGQICEGANWNAWLVFVHHPAIASFLSPFDLGNSEEESKHWLLLDRNARVLYIGTADQVDRCLSEMPTALPEVPLVTNKIEFNALALQQAEALRKAIVEWDSIPSSELGVQEQQSVQDLRNWLGAYWQRSNVCRHHE